jgi:ribose-phosphate pyrophosphokinase
LSGPSIERIETSPLKTLVVTDTIPLRQNAKTCNKIKVLTISKLFGEAIIRSFKGDSVTSLFV